MSSVVYSSLFSENFQNLCLQMVSSTETLIFLSLRVLGFALLIECFPGLSTEKYADFIEANRIEDSVERLKELRRLVSGKSMVCIQMTIKSMLIWAFHFLLTLADPRVT